MTELNHTDTRSNKVIQDPSRLAQSADVCLLLREIESFAQELENSSETTPIGDIVNSINFYSNYSYYEKISDPTYVFQPLNERLYGQLIDTILKYTPHIKRVGSSASPGFEKILWKRLLETKEPLEHLQKFTLLDEPMAATTDLYKQLSLKFKKTLTVLQSVPRAVDSDFTTLKKNLKEFESLEELQLCGRFVKSPIIITEVDDLINNCPTTIHSLTLEECRFLNGYKYPEEIKVNNSITELHLKHSTLSACSLGYFAKKLPGLKKLTVTWAHYDFEEVTQQQLEEWWNQMRQLCQPLQHYNIRIRDIENEKSLDQIRDCAASMVNDLTEITMYLGDLKTMKQNYNIEMKTSDSIIRLYDSQLDMAFEQSKSNSSKIIQSFSSQAIRPKLFYFFCVWE